MTSSGRDALVLLDPSAGTSGTTGSDGASSVGAPRVLVQPCVSIASLCEHGDGAGADRQHARRALERLGLAPRGRGRPASVPRPVTALRPADVAGGEPFALTGRSGRPVYGTLYRPALRGYGGTGRQRAPAGGVVPRRPDLGLSRPASTPPCSSSPPAASPWPVWTTRAARATGGRIAARCGASGAWPIPRTASMRHGIWPRGVTSDAAAHGRPRRQRRRHDGPQRTGRGGGVRCVRLVVRRHRPAWGWWPPRTTSRPTTAIG